MVILHTLTFYIHIVFGSAALALFWIPTLAEKGRLNHVKFGKYYNKAMYIVAASGAVTALLVLWDPVMIHGHRLSNLEYQQQWILQMRVFYGLLLYLSLLVYCSLRQGILTLRSKFDKQPLRAKGHLVPNIVLVAFAPVLFYFGWQHNQMLAMIFATLGLIVGASQLRYCLSSEAIGNRWLREHIGAQMGTGIAAYTAFFAFGGRTLIQNIGDWHILFWVTPGIIGSIAIRKLCEKYAPEHGTNPARSV